MSADPGWAPAPDGQHRSVRRRTLRVLGAVLLGGTAGAVLVAAWLYLRPRVLRVERVYPPITEAAVLELAVELGGKPPVVTQVQLRERLILLRMAPGTDMPTAYGEALGVGAMIFRRFGPAAYGRTVVAAQGKQVILTLRWDRRRGLAVTDGAARVLGSGGEV